MIDLLKARYQERQNELATQELARLTEEQRIVLWREKLFETAFEKFQQTFPHFVDAILERLPEFRKKCHEQVEGYAERMGIDICVIPEKYYVDLWYDRVKENWFTKDSVHPADEYVLASLIVARAESHNVNITLLWEDQE